MDEDLEQEIAEMVARLTPEQYERLGPGLREFGLSIAETREAEREAQRAQELHERVRELYERVLEDLDRAEERVQRAVQLLKDAL